MSRSKITDINAKVAYLTNKRGKKPILKSFRPLFLKDSVRGRGKSTEVSGGCGLEIDSFLRCLSENNFMNASCMKQFQALLVCEKELEKMKSAEKVKLKNGERVNGKFHSTVVSDLLKKYPNPINKESLSMQRDLLNTLPLHRNKPYPQKKKSDLQYDNALHTPDR